MDITDAFLAENIEAVGAVLGDEETDQLWNWVQALYDERAEAKHQALSDAGFTGLDDDAIFEIWMNLAVHAFMAGATYMAANQAPSSLVVEMGPDMVREFIQYLVSTR